MLSKKGTLSKKINFSLPKNDNLINKDPPVTPINKNENEKLI